MRTSLSLVNIFTQNLNKAKKKPKTPNHVVVSTVGTAEQTGEGVPQLDGIVAACADHAACLRV